VRRAAAFVLQAALLAGCCCGLPGGFTPPRPSPPPPSLPPPPPVSTSAPPTVPSGAVGCGGGYLIRAGQAVSATDPLLRDYLHAGETLAVGYVAIELTRAGSEHFPACRVRFSVYRYRNGVRTIEIESERDLHTTDSIYNKSWNIHQAGDWEFVVSDVLSNAPLASVRVTIRE